MVNPLEENLMGIKLTNESIKAIWEYMLKSFPEFTKFNVPFDKITAYTVSSKTMKKFENTENTIKGLALGRTYQLLNKETNEHTYLILLNKWLYNNNSELFNTTFHELLHVIEYETNNNRLTELFEKLVGSSNISEEKVNVDLAKRLLNL